MIFLIYLLIVQANYGLILADCNCKKNVKLRSDRLMPITMSGKVSDLPIRSKRALFTQKKLDRVCVVEFYEIHQVSPLVNGCHALLVMCMVT